MNRRTLIIIVMILLVAAGAGGVGLLQAQRGGILFEAPPPKERPPLTPEDVALAPSEPGPPPVIPTPLPSTPGPTRTPFPPLETWPPSKEWKTYTDPTYNFSFSYPANWELDAPAADDPLRTRGTGFGIGLKNYSMKQYPAAIKTSSSEPDMLKMGIGVYPNALSDGITLRDWVSARIATQDTVVTLEDARATAHSLPAIRKITHSGLMVPEGGTLTYYWSQGPTVFIASAAPGNSIYMNVFEEIIGSLRHHR